jgi:anthranilate phosphoribosyltransferase
MKEIISSQFEKMAKIPQDELEPYNPFAVCNTSVGTKDTPKREKCIHHLKDKNKEENSCAEGEEGMDETKPAGEGEVFTPRNEDEYVDRNRGVKVYRNGKPLPRGVNTNMSQDEWLRLFWKDQEAPVPMMANAKNRIVIQHKATPDSSCPCKK